jgi:hypothetical protein
MKKNLFIVFLIVGLSGCASRQSKLSDNRTFNKIFTHSEIQELQILFDFFNENICVDNEAKNLTKCYKEFFKRFEKTEEFDIPLEEQLILYDKISENTFQEFWGFGKSWNVLFEAPQDTFKLIYLKIDGKYIDFLKEVARNDKVIENYYQNLVTIGDLSPTIVAELFYDYDKYKIRDIRVKFIVAIHYLTLNDIWFRREKIE